MNALKRLIFSVLKVVLIVVVYFVITYLVLIGWCVYEMKVNNVTLSEDFINGLVLSRGMEITVIADIICLVIFGIIYLKRSKGKYSPLNMKPIDYVYVLLLGLFAMYAAENLVSLINIEGIIGNYSDVENMLLKGGLFTQILLIGILIPIFEEVMYRGVIYGYFKEGFGLICGFVFTSLLFGVMHGNLEQGFYAFMISIVFIYGYEKFKTLLAPILMHVLNNSMTIVLNYYMTEEPAYSRKTVFIVMVVAFICLFSEIVIIEKKK